MSNLVLKVRNLPAGQVIHLDCPNLPGGVLTLVVDDLDDNHDENDLVSSKKNAKAPKAEKAMAVEEHALVTEAVASEVPAPKGS